MIYKVYYQENVPQVPIRENTKHYVRRSRF